MGEGVPEGEVGVPHRPRGGATGGGGGHWSLGGGGSDMFMFIVCHQPNVCTDRHTEGRNCVPLSSQQEREWPLHQHAPPSIT